MNYVMVPVPEEIVPQVEQFLQWNAAKPMLGHLEREDAQRFVQSLDPVARRFLLVVADAAVETNPLSVPAAARATGCSELETLGLMLALNESVQYFGTVPLGLIHRVPVKAEIGGATEPGYTLNMRADIGRLLLDAAGRGRVEHE